MYVDIADTFIQYIHSLEPDEIQLLDNNITANGWAIESIVGIKNSVELLQCFEYFYYFNGRFPLTNDLLPVPDRETSPGTEKISIKRLYKFYKGTKSHGLVSPQFLSALNLFFGGNIQLSKDTITELYENLTIETLSGKRQPKFDKILDIISDMKFTMQRSIMSTVKSNEKIK